MNKKDLGTLILNARQKKGMSQEILAQKLHISRQSISNWENNLNIPDPDTLKMLCKILNLNFENISKFANYFPKKSRKFNLYFILILISFLMIFIFVFILIHYRNKFEVYNIYLKTDMLKIQNGIFIKSHVNYYFQLGNIQFNDNEKNINDYKIRLYYKAKNGIKLLIETMYNDNIILNEKYGYNEYFENDFSLDDMYIDFISLENNKETITCQVGLISLFSNDRIFYFENNKIQSNQNKNTDEKVRQKNISSKKLKDNKYKNEYNNYIKSEKNGIFKYDTNLQILYFYNDVIDLTYDFKNQDISGKVFNLNTQKYDIDFYHNNNKFICYSQKCEDYELYENIIVEEVKKLLK